MGAQMVVSYQKVTKDQKRRRKHAREWQHGTGMSRLLHIASKCDICDDLYKEYNQAVDNRFGSIKYRSTLA